MGFTANDIGFNSILVQLEVTVRDLWQEMIRCFNSILVQLEVTFNTYRETTLDCFNSILVQLEESVINSVICTCRVSIPYWCN